MTFSASTCARDGQHGLPVVANAFGLLAITPKVVGDRPDRRRVKSSGALPTWNSWRHTPFRQCFRIIGYDRQVAQANVHPCGPGWLQELSDFSAGHPVRQEYACGTFCSENADATTLDVQKRSPRVRYSECFVHSPGRQSTQSGTPVYSSPDYSWHSELRHGPPVESGPVLCPPQSDALHGVFVDERKRPVGPRHAVPLSMADCPSDSFTWMPIVLSTIPSDGHFEPSFVDGPNGSRDSRFA